ncbi:MAG: hypothetical protein ACLR8P_22080 [Clostridium fessum]
MNAREDKYIISQIISYHEGPERVKAEIAKYDSVIVGDIPAHERNYIIKYSLRTEYPDLQCTKNFRYSASEFGGTESV